VVFLGCEWVITSSGTVLEAANWAQLLYRLELSVAGRVRTLAEIVAPETGSLQEADSEQTGNTTAGHAASL
jgi:hypothetical protein